MRRERWKEDTRDTDEVDREVKMGESRKWERREKGEKNTERQIERQCGEGAEEGKLSSLELCSRHTGVLFIRFQWGPITWNHKGDNYSHVLIGIQSCHKLGSHWLCSRTQRGAGGFLDLLKI